MGLHTVGRQVLARIRAGRIELVTLGALLIVTGACVAFATRWHWPTDVIAGWSVGSAWAIACWLGAEWLQRRRLVGRDTVRSGSGP